MPLPFILAGAAVVAGGYGIKKGLDAKSDFYRAKSLNKRANNKLYDATESLEDTRQQAQYSMEKLGELKFRIYESSFIPFMECFSKIKNIDFDDSSFLDDCDLPVSCTELIAMEQTALEIKELVAGVVTALGTGGLAGLAAYGGVGLLGTESTGTAIGTLSGAAATNATLAWLGGGSLAAGGYDMAGGMMVLGGIVTGPVLAVGGMMLASKAEAAKHDAYSNLDQAELAVEEMKLAEQATKGIQNRFDEITIVLQALNERFEPVLQSLSDLVSQSSNYQNFSDQDKKGVFITASLAKTLKNIMEAPLINEDGSLTDDSTKAIELGKDTLEDLTL